MNKFTNPTYWLSCTLTILDLQNTFEIYRGRAAGTQSLFDWVFFKVILTNVSWKSQHILQNVQLSIYLNLYIYSYILNDGQVSKTSSVSLSPSLKKIC